MVFLTLQVRFLQLKLCCAENSENLKRSQESQRIQRISLSNTAIPVFLSLIPQHTQRNKPGLDHASSLDFITCDSQNIIPWISRYNIMNCCIVWYRELHGIIPCISALGGLKLHPPMSELSKHINIIYIQIYIQYRKAEKDNNKKQFNICDNIIIFSTIQRIKISSTLQRI